MSENNQPSHVIKFGRLEDLLDELSQQGYPVILRITARWENQIVMQMVNHYTARILITAVEQRRHSPIYLWIGFAGQFDEVNGQPYGREAPNRKMVVNATEASILSLTNIINERYGIASREGQYMVDEQFLKGDGVTELVDLFQAYRKDKKGNA